MTPAMERPPPERWRQAIQTYGLETPQAFPSVINRWARTISGRSAPRFTAGPATTAALRAAGAQAASSGDVIHLPGPPSAVGPAGLIVAHELAHLRQPLTRPRFLLLRDNHTPDADEHRAADLQRQAVHDPRLTTMLRATTTADTPDISNGVVAGLPVGSAGSGLMEAARIAARDELTVDGRAAVNAPSGRPGTPPVVGAGVEWVNEMAMASTGPMSDGFSIGAGRGMINNTFGDRTFLDHPGFTVAAPGSPGSPGQATDLGGSLEAGATVAGGAAGAAPGFSSAPILTEHLVDGIVDALEQRVIAEFERRGGRYSGAF